MCDFLFVSIGRSPNGFLSWDTGGTGAEGHILLVDVGKVGAVLEATRFDRCENGFDMAGISPPA